jgi:hypothetical protein
MREIAPKLTDFLESNGINPALVLVVIGILFFAWSVRDINRWESLLYYQRWLVVAELIAAISLVVFGAALILA